MTSIIFFYILLFLVAFLYASVGHGGASGYLALMAFFAFSPETMKSSALILNIIVSLIAFIQYYHAGQFKFKLFWPFAITSIPAAFLGGLITIDADIYKKILAVLLLFPIIRLIGFIKTNNTPLVKQNIVLSLAIGTVIGLFSGMIGIGGGIILTPLILLLHWADMKQTAAVSALFIFVNSIAGLIGLLVKGTGFSSEIYIFIGIALIGGLAGSYMGAKKFESKLLKLILAVVLLIASIKLLTT
jgi:uncharacterized membrane protein YfcA